jgi:hypothetical protein
VQVEPLQHAPFSSLVQGFGEQVVPSPWYTPGMESHSASVCTEQLVPWQHAPVGSVQSISIQTSSMLSALVGAQSLPHGVLAAAS